MHQGPRIAYSLTKTTLSHSVYVTVGTKDVQIEMENMATFLGFCRSNALTIHNLQMYQFFTFVLNANKEDAWEESIKKTKVCY